MIYEAGGQRMEVFQEPTGLIGFWAPRGHKEEPASPRPGPYIPPHQISLSSPRLRRCASVSRRHRRRRRPPSSAGEKGLLVQLEPQTVEMILHDSEMSVSLMLPCFELRGRHLFMTGQNSGQTSCSRAEFL